MSSNHNRKIKQTILFFGPTVSLNLSSKTHIRQITKPAFSKLNVLFRESPFTQDI